ncbi:hypothetical protein ARTHRO_11479 [Limnospira indica PCC 8005]|uniref:Glycosyltransferase 61 catalytic domain-containing protein n=3 Tax=Limnospira TaxID=2596745 RepID=A0A9P1KCW6_9CYAN|nr:hypothetical protein ARTHRO_11479 [Limnospira indica PCC 8005]
MSLSMNTPNRAVIYHNQAIENLKEGKLEEAIACCNFALEMQPGYAEIYMILGKIYIKKQLYNDAIIILKTAIRLSPNLTEAYYNLGQVFLTLNDWKNAVNIFEKLTIIDTANNAWNYYLLGDAFMGLHKWEPAANSYKKAILLNNHNDWFYQKLGDSLRQLNRLSEAINAYQKAIEIKPCPWYYERIGNILSSQHKWDEAISIFIKSLEIDPDYYQAYDKIGIIFEKLGKINFSKLCRMGYKIPPSVMFKYSKLQRNYTISVDDNRFKKKLVYSSQVVNLLQPKTTDNESLSYFVNKKVKFPDAFVAQVQNSTAWGSSCTSAIITEDQKIINDLSTGTPEIILTSNYLPKPIKVSGRIAILSVQYTYNYFHWMFEIVARLMLLLEAGITFDNLDGIFISGHGKKYEQETLELLKIPMDRVIDNSINYIKADCLIVPSVSPRPLITNGWSCKMLKNLILNSQKFEAFSQSIQPISHIYITRNKSQYRKILNEAKLICFLEKFGFKVLTLEGMSVIEQAAYFTKAEMVISPHGASLTNLVFCLPGTKVIEIFAPGSIIDYYWKLSSICHLDYYYLIAKAPEDLTPTAAHVQNFNVNLDSVLQTLKLAGFF